MFKAMSMYISAVPTVSYNKSSNSANYNNKKVPDTTVGTLQIVITKTIKTKLKNKVLAFYFFLSCTFQILLY